MRGFTLIELVVTLGLLALLAAAIFGFYVNGIRASQHAQGLAVATGLAQAREEMLKSGPPDEAIRAETEVRTTNIPGYLEKLEVIEVAPGLRQITVTIIWTWRGQPRQTTLTTIVMEPEAP